MDIIIKQRDSIVSIMLFLYNSFLLPKDKRALGLERVFKLLEPFEKSETAVRVGLSRAVKSNILKNYKKGKDVYYEITEQGLQAVEEWRQLFEVILLKYKSSQEVWNNNWEVVSMTLPRDLSEKRDELNRKLREYGFGLLNKSIWVSPYRFSQSILKYAKDLEIEECIAVFESKLVQKPVEFVESIWNLEQINEEYKNFNNKYNELDTKEFITKEQAIVFLLNLGWEYVSIAGSDPLLPPSLLDKGWEGYQAFILFNRLRSKFLKLADEYVNDVIRV